MGGRYWTFGGWETVPWVKGLATELERLGRLEMLPLALETLRRDIVAVESPRASAGCVETVCPIGFRDGTWFLATGTGLGWDTVEGIAGP